jgi:hypothetical protein
MSRFMETDWLPYTPSVALAAARDAGAAEERARIVAMLREYPAAFAPLSVLADRIERGET